MEEEGGGQHTMLPHFSENCMKLKEFGRGGGGGCVQNFTMYIRHIFVSLHIRSMSGTICDVH